MGINAGLIIPTTQSSISYDSNAGVWKGVIIQINYLFGQNSGSNPPVVGDIIVDQEPRVWEITATGGSLSGNRFGIDTKCLSETPSLQVIPKLNTQRGMICSPNAQGFIDPHWDSTVVELVPFRMAMRYNFNMNPNLGNLGSDGTVGAGGGIPKARTISNTPPSYAQNGSIYIIGTNPTGVWAGRSENIAIFSDNSWSFKLPNEGDFYWIDDLNNFYYYNHLGNWAVFEGGGGGSGVTNFLQLNDTPSSFTGKSGYVLRINSSESGIELVDPSSVNTGGGDTGGDTGTIGSDGGSGSGITFSAENVITGSGETFPVKVKTGDFQNPMVASSERHFLMVGTDNKLYAVGDNSSGQFGIGNNTTGNYRIPFYSSTDSVPTIINWSSYTHQSINYKKIYAKYNSSACIDEDGVLYVWGDNRNKKLGSNTMPFLTSPEKIDTVVGVKKFEIGETFCFYQGVDNYLYKSNGNGGFIKITPFEIKDFGYVAQHLYAVKTDGRVYNLRDNTSADTLFLFTTDNYYVKNIFPTSIVASNYDSGYYSSGSPFVLGTTEYNTVYSIDRSISVDSQKEKIMLDYNSNLSAAGSIGIRQIKAIRPINNSTQTAQYSVTNDGFFLARWGISTVATFRVRRDHNINNVNYITVNPRMCYIIFNDGSVRTHPKFKSVTEDASFILEHFPSTTLDINTFTLVA